MSGHVFHPGHQELHGITVVLDTTGTRTYVGRFDSQDDHGVLMNDVGVFDASAGGLSREEYLRRTVRFGIRADHKSVVVPVGEVARIVRLTELAGE